eukprot:10490962-Alexandrium_andersonii.AAC.1
MILLTTLIVIASIWGVASRRNELTGSSWLFFDDAAAEDLNTADAVYPISAPTPSFTPSPYQEQACGVKG